MRRGAPWLAWAVLGLAGSTLLAFAGPAAAAPGELVLGSTTSTRDSGLTDWLVDAFTEETGIVVRTVAMGTGRALKLGERGDVDLLLVHDTASEERFMAAGFGELRRKVMYNDFVLVGPASDPAGVRDAPDIGEALRGVAASRSWFLSRGDDSGTHKAELRCWMRAGLDPRPDSGTWYRESGAGMGATLNTAAEMGAYTLADRGTWLRFGNRGGLRVVFEGGPALRNVYGVLVVSQARHPHVNAADARRFADWLVSPIGQARIAAFQLEGETLFHPLAEPAASAGEVGAP